jgi:hypothetical protein
MVRKDYEQAIGQARRDLANAVFQRDFYNLEILRLQQVVNALAVSASNAEIQERVNEEWQVFVELTQAIEAIVNGSFNPISPIEVRDTLVFYGYNIGRYANPMAMVHQTLKRLVADGRIGEFRGRYTKVQAYADLLKR